MRQSRQCLQKKCGQPNVRWWSEFKIRPIRSMPETISPTDFEALRRAVRYLERTSFAARLTSMVGSGLHRLQPLLELNYRDGLKRTATVRAATDECCVIELERENVESMLPVEPHLVYKVMRAIIRSAHRTVSTMDKTYLDLMSYIQG
jgi:hypothetical protein